MSCGCNNKGTNPNTKCDCASCKYTGDLTFDGQDFECDLGTAEEPNVQFSVTSGTGFNAVLALIFAQLCALWNALANTGFPVIVQYNTNALGGTISQTDDGDIPAGMSYTVPNGTGTALYECLVTMNIEHNGDTTVTVSAFKDDVKIDVNTDKILDHVQGVGQPPVVPVTYFISQVELTDGETFAIKHVASAAANISRNGVFILRKIS